MRPGTRPKTVLTESSDQVQTDVLRGRAGALEPQQSDCNLAVPKSVVPKTAQKWLIGAE